MIPPKGYIPALPYPPVGYKTLVRVLLFTLPLVERHRRAVCAVLDVLTVLLFAIQYWKGETTMTKRTNVTSSQKASPLMVRLDSESKQALTDAAELRRISVSDYVRTVTVAQARREVASAREQTVLLSPDEQLAFWQALQFPAKLTPAQKRLGAIMRGVP